MRQTPLHDVHGSLGARMVDFAGWSMPLHYRGGINQEHIAVRTGVGLFDVSHMGEVRILGDGAGDFLSFATLNDPSRLRTGRAQYNMIPNASGGLIDDVYLYRDGDNEFLLVANAANTTAVIAHLKALAKPFRCHVLDESDTWSLLALQGPGGALLLGRLVDVDLTSLRKNRSTDAEISGCPVRLTRTGYTGEDGFEILLPSNRRRDRVGDPHRGRGPTVRFGGEGLVASGSRLSALRIRIDRDHQPALYTLQMGGQGQTLFRPRSALGQPLRTAAGRPEAPRERHRPGRLSPFVW